MVTRWFLVFLIVASWQMMSENSHSQSSHNPEIQSQDADKSDNEKPFSIPVRILEAPVHKPVNEVDRDRQRHDDAYTEKNISIQEVIAKASENVAHYTFHQVWISALSLLGLALTVAFSGLAWRQSIEATKTAEKALAVTEDTARKQLRAYLVITGTKIPADTPEGYFYVRTGVKNCGQTPAMITHIGKTAFLCTGLSPELFPPLSLEPYTAIVGPGQDLAFHFGNTSKKLDGLRELVAAGQLNAAMRFHVKYTDIYGISHHAYFTRVIEGQRELNADFNVSLDYPDEAD